MRLVYTQDQPRCNKKAGDPVAVGDTVDGFRGPYIVEYFAKPHSQSSSGKVAVASIAADGTIAPQAHEVYVSIINAEWIEREDRA